MRQTISGETHKTRIFDKKFVTSFIEDSKLVFEDDSLEENCIYDSLRQTDDRIINFLNIIKEKEDKLPYGQLRQILKKEFDECEKIYPYLGDAFLYLFFDSKILKNKSVKILNRNTCNNFLNTISEQNSKNIIKWLIENSSPDREIDIQESYIKDIEISVRDDTFFNIAYDCDFLGSNKEVIMKNYRFIIIDGFLESIGEIHHLLHYAAESKEPHVIFCFGMSEEVKSVIIENNTRGITKIFPISMTFDESSINILNDIALIHDSEIISALKGQTISQEMRKSLSIGKSISITRNGFSVDPVADETKIKCHIKYLQKRINDTNAGMNTDIIKTRIKNIKSKSLTIFINKTLSKNSLFNRSLDYGLRMLKNSNQPYYLIDLENKKIMVPTPIYSFLNKKVNMTKKLFYNIEKSVLISNKE
jgi:hypothetical protein|tara:strand:- start:437 stop:1693 length:1257 start_codon:yes stop_codon:yes gene_type:complete